jgi:hypothetical protein
LKLITLQQEQRVQKRQQEQMRQQLQKRQLEQMQQEQERQLEPERQQEQLAFRHKQTETKLKEQQRVRSISFYFLN